MNIKLPVGDSICNKTGLAYNITLLIRCDENSTKTEIINDEDFDSRNCDNVIKINSPYGNNFL